jgi:hypothetical protein
MTAIRRTQRRWQTDRLLRHLLPSFCLNVSPQAVMLLLPLVLLLPLLVVVVVLAVVVMMPTPIRTRP